MASSFLHLPSPSSNVAAAVGPHGVTRSFSAKGLHLHASPLVAAQGPLVSNGGRPSRSDPFVAILYRSSTVVAPGGQVAVRSSSAGSALVLVVVYRYVPVWLGAHLLYLTALGVWSEEETQEHISVLEIRVVELALAAFLPQVSGRVSS